MGLRRGRYLVTDVLGGAGIPSGSIIINDTFTAADGTNLAGHAPDVAAYLATGQTWSVLTAPTATMKIVSNKATVDAGSNPVARISAGIATGYVLTADINTATVGAGILVRVKDATNWWQIASLVASDELTIAESNAGVLTIRATTPMVVGASVLYTVTITLSGATITAQIGATTVSYASSLHATETGVGIRNIGAATTDNFKVVYA